jgi:hypothetical protein
MAILSNSFFSTARRRLLQQHSISSSRYLVRIVFLLCLMSLITLGQTGVVATKGYAVANLAQQRTELIRMRNQFEMRYAAAQSLENIRNRAETIGLRPISREQVRYITIVDKNVVQSQSPLKYLPKSDNHAPTTKAGNNVP